MTVREIVIDVANRLPDDATIDDVISQLCLRMKVEEGIRQLDDGQGIPHEEAKKRLGKWLE